MNPAKISGICGRLMCCLKYESQLTTSNHRRGKIIERTVTELKTIIRDIILEVGELKSE